VAGICYAAKNLRVMGNDFRHSNSSSVDARVVLGADMCDGQPTDLLFEGNSLHGVRIHARSFDGLSIRNNTFWNITTGFYNIAIALYKGTYGVARNFEICGNAISTDNRSISTAVYVSPAISDPGRATVGPNRLSSGISPLNSDASAKITVVGAAMDGGGSRCEVGDLPIAKIFYTAACHASVAAEVVMPQSGTTEADADSIGENHLDQEGFARMQ
jgi:hypothetical protein